MHNIHAYVLRVMKGIYQFAANLLSYIPTKYYWNQSTSDLVIAKSKRVNFFLKHSVVLVVQYLFCCEYVVVLFRVITVYPDLKPFKQEINVSISVRVFFSYSLTWTVFIRHYYFLCTIPSIVNAKDSGFNFCKMLWLHFVMSYLGQCWQQTIPADQSAKWYW